MSAEDDDTFVSLDALPTIRAGDVPSVSAARMADADRFVADVAGVSLETLMRNASRQVATATRALLGDVDGKTIAAVVGSGNNGGDALGALSYLQEWGAAVDAFLAFPVDALRPLARRQYDLLEAADVPRYHTAEHDDRFLVHRLRSRSAVIDGLLGYSAHGAPRGELARLIRIANASVPTPIVAVDVPSGLDPDAGAPLSPLPDQTIRATVTLTLGLPKTGLTRAAARPYVGILLLADIGIPPQAYERIGIDARGMFAAGDLLRVAA